MAAAGEGPRETPDALSADAITERRTNMFIDSLSLAGILVSAGVVLMLLVMLPRWRGDLREEEVRDDERD